jgi:cell division protein FtsW (lipid II flippase)
VATVSTVRYQRGRGSELVLLGIAGVIAVLARALVDYHADVLVISDMLEFTAIVTVVLVGINLALRRWARDADPVIVPAVAALTGVGLAMIRRIDFAYAERGRDTSFGEIQSMWVLIGIALCVAVVFALRDYRLLRRFTYTAGILGLIGLLLPLVPGLGRQVNGAQIWIGIFGRSLQPGEFAKILLVIFFAGYLQTNRDALAVAGPKVLGIRFPRARDMGPLLVVWLAAIAVMVFERDLGTSLLLFGIFVAMLYVATRRTSWVVLGVGLFLFGAAFAGSVFGHVRARYTAWLHALDPEVYFSGQSEQLVRGLFGMASGGLFGTGLGEGRPDLVPYAESDFIIASLGEELGLTGLLAIMTLYVILVQRAMRTAIGVRDGFGKLLAAGLGFTVAFQAFIVIAGVMRVIPLTGLATPFLAYGGSAMIANWIIIGLLLRISDQARRPTEVMTG